MVNISSLRFDESVVSGWHLADNHERGRGWMDAADPSQMSSTFTIDWNPPDELIPREVIADNIQMFREDRKQKANANGMTLLEQDVVTNPNGISLIRVIEKKPMQPHGMAYYGSLTLLEEASGFIIQMWCFERGTTGVRDSMIMAEFPSLDPTREDWGGWWIDPHGFGKQTPLMYNVAELEKYDAKFPDHPLTRVRQTFGRVIQSLDLERSANPPSFFGKLFGKK